MSSTSAQTTAPSRTSRDRSQTLRPHRDGVAAAVRSGSAGAAAVRELIGGRFGEMSTFMNYTFQSFNFRGRQGARPFYDLVANIAAEEFRSAANAITVQPSDH